MILFSYTYTHTQDMAKQGCVQNNKEDMVWGRSPIGVGWYWGRGGVSRGGRGEAKRLRVKNRGKMTRGETSWGEMSYYRYITSHAP